MKYTKEQVNQMSWQEWNETMARELTFAGFRNTKHTDNGYEEVPISANFEPKYFVSSELNNADRIEYLKDIGLLNNGRCPICGGIIADKPGKYTNRFDKAINYQICHNCTVTRGGYRNASKSKNSSSGCMVVIVALFIISAVCFILI